MIALKQFRNLTDPQYLEIARQENAFVIAETENRMMGLIEDKPENYFTDAVAARQMDCFDIAYHGEPLYRIFCQLNGDCLHVCVSMNISNRQNESAWGNGVEKLARQFDCKHVTFQTARLGHVAVAKNWGARITGFTMKKTL